METRLCLRTDRLTDRRTEGGRDGPMDEPITIVPFDLRWGTKRTEERKTKNVPQ